MIPDAGTNGHFHSEISDTPEIDAHEDSTLQKALLNGCQSEEENMTAESIRHQFSLDSDEMQGALEALLFVSHDPLSLEKLASVLEGVPKASVKTAMQTLQAEYEKDGRGLKIVEVAGGYVMVTKPELGGYLKRLAKAKPTSKVSRSALETLAIISYKQPITRADIEKIRGVETSGVLRTLLDQKLIRIVGRQDIPGRPILYGTSKQFLLRFGLRDLRDLPPLKELKDLGLPEQGTMELPLEVDGRDEGSRVADLSA